MRVVLIDDESDIREVVTLSLEMSGMDVRSTGDASEAVSLIRETMPALILLDQSLGEISGVDVLMTLREDSELRSIPVVFLTGHHDAATRRALIAAGAAGVITKPFDPLGLAGQLAELLEEPNRAPAAARGMEPEAVIDQEALEGVFALESSRPGFVRRIVEQFREDVEERLELMRRAGESDRAGIERTAHALKSSAGHLGASRVWSIADAIESSASGDEVPLQPRIEQLVAAYEEAIEEIERQVASRPELGYGESD